MNKEHSLFPTSPLNEEEKPSKEDAKPKPYTVTQLTARIKKYVERVGSIWLTGEVSALKRHSSGHIYLTLKDHESQIGALIWRSTAKTISFPLKDGLEVLVCGDISVYGPQSKYQIIISSLEPRGAGALQVAFDALKKRLEKEGLFDKKYKKVLPYLPRRIGVVTSPTGAAVKDILNVIKRRCPQVEIYIYPVRVQGDLAAGEIATAIKVMNSQTEIEIDVMIVGRGGGSPEDLWAFNEEIVAKAIFASKIPIISAVGHEIDTSISDLVADRRALTPTEAGELVVPRIDLIHEQLGYLKRRLDKAMYNRVTLTKAHLAKLATHRAFTKPLERVRHLEQRLDITNQKLRSALERLINRKRMQLTKISGRLLANEPTTRLQRHRQRLTELEGRLTRAFQKRVEWERRRLTNLSAQLEALSPLSILARGYSIAYVYSGKEVLKNIENVKPGDHIWTRFSESWILSKVEKTGIQNEEKQ